MQEFFVFSLHLFYKIILKQRVFLKKNTLKKQKQVRHTLQKLSQRGSYRPKKEQFEHKN